MLITHSVSFDITLNVGSRHLPVVHVRVTSKLKMAPTGLICVLHRIFVMENGPNVLQCKNVKKLRYEII